MQLHGFEEVVLLGPQDAAHIPTDRFEFTAFGFNGVLSVVGVLDQTVALIGQQGGSVQHLLWSSVERRSLTPPPSFQHFFMVTKSAMSGFLSAVCLSLFCCLIGVH